MIGVVMILGGLITACHSREEDALYEAAQKQWEEKMYAMAAKTYEGFAFQYPESSKAAGSLYKTGMIYAYYLMEPSRALEVFHRLATLYPNTPEAVEGQECLAEVYENHLRLYSEAIVVYSGLIQRLEKEDPRLPEYYYKMARCCFLSDDLERAAMNYEKILDDFPKSEDAQRAAYQIGYIYFLQNRFVEAEKAFGHFLEQYPQGEWTFEGMLHRARCLEKDNRASEAEQIYREMSQRFPNSMKHITGNRDFPSGKDGPGGKKKK